MDLLSSCSQRTRTHSLSHMARLPYRYNKTASHFDTKEAYDDYLEHVEDLSM